MSGQMLGEVPLRRSESAVSSLPAAEGVPGLGAEVGRFASVLTLVVWVGCTSIAVLGFAMPYARPQAKPAPPQPMAVEMLKVELSNEPLPEPELPAANPLALPPPSDLVAQPQLPQPVAVAIPSLAIAFAVPVEGPVRVVEAAQAGFARSESAAAAPSAAPPVQRLTFGQRAGKQPAPEYPLAAQNAGQEGVVNVRFTVADNGRVVAAETASPSPWPLLNDSAVRTVRQRWRFPAGVPRAYEVAIRFVLPK
jgi:periplasmic protein TonB